MTVCQVIVKMEEKNSTADESDCNHQATASVAGRDGHKEPRIVKFGYKEFKVKGDKWFAVCTKCNKNIQDKVNVTSAFTK